ncbi:MAG: hypothetical protein EBS05_26230 [Proteobacteria bacterium]|nr:hypothetical protein [Pseudomonadota bacterium]
MNLPNLSSSRCGARDGYALLMVMVFSAIGLLVLAGTMDWASQTSMMNERSNQGSTTTYAAEASTERIVSRLMSDYKASGESTVYNNLNSYRTNVPASGENAYWGNFQFSNASGTTNQNYVDRTQTQIFTNLSGPYTGLRGFVSNYRVISNARQSSGRFVMTNAVQQDIQLASIPVFQFAIFFNSLLEFTMAAPLTVRGRIHANSNIFLGSSSDLTLQENVTATGSINKQAWFGYALSSFTGGITYGGTVTSNTSALTLPIGTNNSAAAVREVINIPPVGESMSSPMGQQRFYNKAEMLILVSNATVVVKVKTPFDASPTTINWSNANYFVTTNTTFTDQREGKTILTTELDIAKFNTWAATNSQVNAKLGSGNVPNIIYVADDRTATASQKTAVRVINGLTLSNRGLTLATVNPLYVKGNFNCTNAAHLGTTNTTSAGAASLIADALTIQSGAWSDALSASTYTSRVPTDTTVNAALLAGMVYSSADGNTVKSGGVVNFPRLLEAWSGHTLTLNGSLVNMFDSARATAPFLWPGTYYSAPNRNFNFDPDFLDSTKMPPGSPELRVMIRGAWAAVPPNRTNYVVSF